jgi:hypothetical protein
MRCRCRCLQPASSSAPLLNSAPGLAPLTQSTLSNKNTRSLCQRIKNLPSRHRELHLVMLRLHGTSCAAMLLIVLFLTAPITPHACTFEAGDKVFDLGSLYNAAGYTMMSNGYQYRFDICNSCDNQCRTGPFASCSSQVYLKSRADFTSFRSPNSLFAGSRISVFLCQQMQNHGQRQRCHHSNSRPGLGSRRVTSAAKMLLNLTEKLQGCLVPPTSVLATQAANRAGALSSI